MQRIQDVHVHMWAVRLAACRRETRQADRDRYVLTFRLLSRNMNSQVSNIPRIWERPKQIVMTYMSNIPFTLGGYEDVQERWADGGGEWGEVGVGGGRGCYGAGSGEVWCCGGEVWAGGGEVWCCGGEVWGWVVERYGAVVERYGADSGEAWAGGGEVWGG